MFLTGGGGVCAEGETEDPKQKGGSKKAATWRVDPIQSCPQTEGRG